MRGSTAYGVTCARSTRSLLGAGAADTLGLLHRVFLFLVLRLGVARGVRALSGIDELARALVVFLRAAVASFAFNLRFVCHDASCGLLRKPRAAIEKAAFACNFATWDGRVPCGFRDAAQLPRRSEYESFPCNDPGRGHRHGGLYAHH